MHMMEYYSHNDKQMNLKCMLLNGKKPDPKVLSDFIYDILEKAKTIEIENRSMIVRSRGLKL